jgi:hypothetical protein
MTRQLRDSALSEMDRMRDEIKVLQKLLAEPRPTVRVRRTSNATIAAFSGSSRVAWQVADYDTDGIWSAGSPADLVAQTAGQYRIWTGISYSGDIPLIVFLKNLVDMGPIGYNQRSFTMEAELDAGDSISMAMSNVSTPTPNTGTINAGSLFGMSFIGPKLTATT